MNNHSVNNQVAAFNRLVDSMRRAKSNHRPFCVFLGAGCSLSSSNHPITTEQVIKDCLLQCMGSDYVLPKSWENLYKEFVNKVWAPYAPNDRQEILYERFKDLEPSIGYKMLKELIVNGFIQYVITTNFDMLLDKTLSDVPHNVQVSDLPVRKHKGGSNIFVFKVHGDIENGNLRFSPNELIELPKTIGENINHFSKNNCLICGYRGQDEGIMKNLNDECKYSSFWASPNLPLISDVYETEKIYSWMTKRNSKDNFIYGDSLGAFDELMSKLAFSLLNDKQNILIPYYWDNNAITNCIKTNQKAYGVFLNVLNCSKEYSDNINWESKFPFFSEQYETVLNAYLFFYKQNESNILLPLKFPENEIESLLFGVAIEIIARTSGINITPFNYALEVKGKYKEHKYECTPDNSFWEALLVIIKAIENKNIKQEWTSIQSIKLNLNSGGRYSATIKNPMLKEIANVLFELNICSLLLPTCTSINENDIKQRAKLLLEKHALPITVNDAALSISFDKMTRDEYEQVYSIFFNIQPNIINIIKPKFEQKNEDQTVSSNSIYEYLVSKSNSISTVYQSLKTVFEYDRNIYVKTDTDTMFEDFVNSKQIGMYLIGSSGSGKTKSIQHFIETYKSEYIIAATSPKCTTNKDAFGLLCFFSEFFSDRTIKESKLLEINDVLMAYDRRMVLIYDGINEMDNGFTDSIKQHRSFIELINLLSKLKISSIKVIVSCRDFAFLEYCKQTGLYPSAENCYGNYKNEKYIPYVQISQLTLKNQIDFCNAYIDDNKNKNWFISLLKTNDYFRTTFSHPYLLAIASHYFENTDIGEPEFINSIFMKFTDEMLNRLPKTDDKFLAQKIIDEYCSMLLNTHSYHSITKFTLLSNEKFTKNRDEAYKVLTELIDINLFTGSLSFESIRISHDRIEEYLLFRFIYFSNNSLELISSAMKLLTVDSIFSNSIQKCIDKLLYEHRYSIVIDNVSNWYNINPQIIPTIISSALLNLEKNSCIDFFNRVLVCEKSDLIIKIVLAGLKNIVVEDHRNFSLVIVEAFEIITKQYLNDNEYLCEFYYISSKYYSETKNNYYQAKLYCEKALQYCNENSNMYYLLQLQQTIISYVNHNEDSILLKYKELFTYFKSKELWEHATECVLHWGSLLRQQTKFEEAIYTYELIETKNVENNPLLLASLKRKIGTANKNIMQRLIREKSSEWKKIYKYYKNAIASFTEAQNLLSKRYDFELLSLISEITETAILIIAYDSNQRYFADIYLTEEEKLLSYLPIPEYEILHIRNKARLLAIDKRYKEAIDILVSAKDIAVDPLLAFRLFEVNYQICRLVAKNHEELDLQTIRIGLNSLNEALDYPLDMNNEYRQALLQTKKTFDIIIENS